MRNPKELWIFDPSYVDYRDIQLEPPANQWEKENFFCYIEKSAYDELVKENERLKNIGQAYVKENDQLQVKIEKLRQALKKWSEEK